MSYEYLTIERTGGIVTATYSSPPLHTLTAPAIEELLAFLDTLEGDDEVRVVIFRGCGEGFFARHYDVGELVGLAGAIEKNGAEQFIENAGKQFHGTNRVGMRIEAAPWIGIAALNGSAAGGAFEISLACDFRLMADGPYEVGLPETTLGILPGAGGTQRLARLIGSARAMDMILNGILVGPKEALTLGIVQRVFPEDTFDRDVMAFAQNLASRPQLSLALAKENILNTANVTLDEGLIAEQISFMKTMATEDARTKMLDYVEGRMDIHGNESG